MILLQSRELVLECKKIRLQHIINLLITFVLLSPTHRKTTASPAPKSIYETDNFTALLLHNDLFVDKSLLINEFLVYDNSQFASTIVRPKGWGKSTNIHMLEKFFEIEVDENGIPLPKNKTINDKLFLGGTINLSSNETKTLKRLKIASFSNITKHLGKHPVILLRLENATGKNYEELEGKIKSSIVEVFKRHEYLSRSSNITQKEIFEKYLKGDLNTTELRDSLHFLSLKLKEHFGQEVFLLVDDYDVPLISAYREFEKDDRSQESEKAVELLRYILSAARKRSIDIPNDFIPSTTKKYVSSTNYAPKANTSIFTSDPSRNTTNVLNITSDPLSPVSILNTTNSTTTPDPITNAAEDSDISDVPPLEQRNTALLTGVLDLAFENPKTQISLEFDKVYTLFDEPFAEHYGFTHQEVQHLLTKISKSVDSDKLKLWYNGYNYKFLHEKQPQFYIPRSVMRYLQASQDTFGYYGDDEDIDNKGIIYEILSSDGMQEDIQLLIASASQWIGGYTYMCSPVRWERSKIPEVLSNKRTILMFHGLLGPCRPDPFHNGPNTGIPNKEARCVYETNMMRWVCKKFSTDANDLQGFVGLLSTGFMNQFRIQLQKYLTRASEFIKSSEYNAKISYRGLMTAVKKILVETGQESIDLDVYGAIRSINDIVLVPKPPMSKIAFLIHYKIVKEKNITEESKGKNLTEEAEAELEHIDKIFLNGTLIENYYPEVKKLFKVGIAFCGEKVEIQYDIRETTSNKNSTTGQPGDYILKRRCWKNGLVSSKQAIKHHYC